MPNLRAFFLKIADSYITVLVVAVTLGLVFPHVFAAVTPYLTWLLMVIFYLNSLRIEMGDVVTDFKDWRMIALGTGWMLLGAPIVVWAVTSLSLPQFLLPFLILAAMPAGTTLPLLVEVIGGRPSMALVFTVTSSLLAPFTVPLVLHFLAGKNVQVDTLGMFWSLVQVIVIPFVLAQLTRRFAPKQVTVARQGIKSSVVLLLCLLIASVVANQAGTIETGQVGPFFAQTLAVVALFLFFAVSGWLIAWYRTPKEQLTMSMNVTCINFTLAIFLTNKYFPNPHVVVPVVLSVLPWTLFIIPFKLIAASLDLPEDPDLVGLPWWRRWLKRVQKLVRRTK
jgi:BASS family bile acid:Na+ symporter